MLALLAQRPLPGSEPSAWGTQEQGQPLLPPVGSQVSIRVQEDADPAGFPSTEIQRLQEHNASLRCAITQMRQEMEALSGHLDMQHPQATQSDPAASNPPSPPGEEAFLRRVRCST